MIDLDNQLAAYARYLDDTERSVVFLQPERLPLHSRVSRSHRRIALAAACVIALGGAIAIGTTRFGGRDGVSGTVTPPGEWALVDDPDGVFVPPPGGASVGDEQHGAISENAIWVHSVEPIGDGFLAVGDEMHGFAPVGAVWRSADGESWERLAHDDSFGALGISEDPTASGPSMADVAARDGRVVIAGSLTLGRDPAVWWSDDLNEWHMIEVGATGQTQPAIAASERGFAMVGIAYGSTGTRDSAAGWFSTDGLTWVPATFEDGAGSRVGDVIATEDGWVAAGSVGTAAAIWTSRDGLEWRRADVEQTPSPAVRFTSIQSLVAFHGNVVGYGSADSSGNVGIEGVGGRLTPTGTAQPAVWISSDGGRWTAVSPVTYRINTLSYSGPIVATDDELIALGEELVVDEVTGGHPINFELRSMDGIVWTRRDLDLAGARTAAAFANGVAVALGDATDQWAAMLAGGTYDPDEITARAASVWILPTD